MSQVGRISGALLHDNLLRKGTATGAYQNLTFSSSAVVTGGTPTLHFDVINGRIGIQNDTPVAELHVTGSTRVSTTLNVETNADIANINFQSSAIQPFPGSLYFNSQGVITANNIQTDNLNIDFNRIKAITNNTSIEFSPNGTGEVGVFSNLEVYGDLHATGDISFDGNIIFGDALSQDNIVINAEISSDVVPDTTGIYSLGTIDKRWKDVEAVLLNGQDINTAVATVLGVNLSTRQGKLWYVALNGNNTNVGDHQQGPYRTIEYALTQATSGDTVFVYPGEYEESFPLEIPVGVTLTGHNQRNTIVYPASSQSTTDIFLLNGETSIQNITVKDFFYDNINDVGYAFRFAPGGKVTSRSPYVQNITVITKGSTTTTADPRGFISGDAGKGILVDGAVLASDTREASMLFHAVTLITPGVDALTMTNGVRVEWLNSFSYFANRGMYATNGTGRVDDNLVTRYGAEVRSIGSANIYGNYGAVADGADTLMYLVMHNFGYVGSAADSSNDKTLAIQANEVVEFNNGRVQYQSQSHTGDFRVGDSFFIDFEKGSQTFNINDIPVVGVDTITVTTGAAVTYLDLEYVQTGNVRLVNNSLAAINGDLNISAISGSTILDGNVKIEKDLDVSGNLTIGGALISFGNNQSIDTITFESGINTSLLPKTTDQYNIGSQTQQWSNVWLTQSFNDNFNITNNFIETTLSNSNLELRANGTGQILLSDTVVFEQDLTVTTGLTTILNLTSVRNFDLGAGFVQTGELGVIGNFSIGNNLTVGSTAQFENILISGNLVTTTNTNSDLELLASSTGLIKFNNDVVVNNDLTVNNSITASNLISDTDISVELFTNSDLEILDNNITALNGNLEISATGNVVIPDNSVQIDNNLIVNSDSNLQNIAITGLLDRSGNTDQNGNYILFGNISVTNFVTTDRQVQLENILINDNVITTTQSNSNLELLASSTGLIKFNNNVVIGADLTVTNSITASNLISDTDISAELFTNNDLTIFDNNITALNGNLEISATGNVVIPDNSVQIDNNLIVNGNSSVQGVIITGLLDRSGNTEQTGNYILAGNISVTNFVTTDRQVQLENILINDNVITTTQSNSNLELRASGTGIVNFKNSNVDIQTTLTVDNLFANSLTAPAITSATLNTASLTIAGNKILSNVGNLTLTGYAADAADSAKIIITSNNFIAQQDLDVVGLATRLKDTLITGTLTQTGNTTQVGNLSTTGNIDVTQNISVAKSVQFEEILIDDNIVSTTTSNTDLELRANGSGNVSIPNSNVEVLNNLTVNNNIEINIVASDTVITTEEFNTTQINISDNTVTTTSGNLELRASGTGTILVPNNAVVLGQDLIVLNVDLQATTITGTLTLSTPTDAVPRIQVGNATILGDVTVSNLLTVSTNARFENIEFNENFITTLASNSDLELRAAGTGVVRINDDIIVTNDVTIAGILETQSITSNTTISSNTLSTDDILINDNNIIVLTADTDLDLSATGDVNFNNLTVNQTVDVDGAATLADVTIIGSLTQIGDLSQTGSTVVTGNVTFNGILTVDRQAQIENILIDDNIITTVDSNSNLELRANSTGRVLVPSNDVIISNNLFVDTGIPFSSNNIDRVITTTSYGLTTLYAELQTNILTTTVTDQDLIVTGTNETNIQTASIVEENLISNAITTFSTTEITGLLTHIGDKVVTGNVGITGSISANANIDVTSYGQLGNIRIDGNTVKTTSGNLDLSSPGVGTVNVSLTNVEIDQDLTVLGTINANGIQNVSLTSADQIITDRLTIFDNNINATGTNTDVVLVSAGAGSVVIDTNNAEFGAALTVSDATLGVTNITGDITHTGARIERTAFDITGKFTVGTNLTVSNFADLDDIRFTSNRISTLISNADLELRATGDVVVNNGLTVTQGFSVSTLTLNSANISNSFVIESNAFETDDISITGNTIESISTGTSLVLTANNDVVLANTVEITNDLSVTGLTTFNNDVDITGTVNHTGNRTVNNLTVDGDLTVTGNVVATQVQFEEININDNVITTTSTDADLELRASDTGDVQFDIHTRILQNLQVNGVTSINELTVQSTITAETFKVDDIEVYDNRIQTTVTNSDLELRAAGTGSIVLADININANTVTSVQSLTVTVDGNVNVSGTNAIKLPSGSTVQKSINTAGDFRFNTTDGVFEGYTTVPVTFAGVYSTDRTTSVTADTLTNELRFDVNNTRVATIKEGNVALNGLILPTVTINGSSILGTVTNTDLTISNGTGIVNIEDVTLEGTTITNNTNTGLVIQNTGAGITVLSTSTGVKIPAGGNAQRTGIEVGDTRWNTDSEVLETYDGNVYISSAGTSNNITPEEFSNLLFEYTLIFG